MNTPSPHQNRPAAVTVRGDWVTDTWTQGQRYSAVAYVVLPKVAGGTRYTVIGTGFNDAAYYGMQLSLSFTPVGAITRPADGYGDMRVQDRGDSWWVCLSSISGPVGGLADAAPYFEARFGGMQVSAVVSLGAPPG